MDHRENEVKQVLPDSLEPLVNKDPLDREVNLAKLEHLEHVESQVKEARQELQDRLDDPVKEERLAHKVRLVQQDQVDLLDLPVNGEKLDHEEKLEQLENLVRICSHIYRQVSKTIRPSKDKNL